MTESTRNGKYAGQARLAVSLVEALGLDGAISACRANGWDGVLACLLDPRRMETEPSAAGPRDYK